MLTHLLASGVSGGPAAVALLAAWVVMATAPTAAAGQTSHAASAGQTAQASVCMDDPASPGGQVCYTIVQEALPDGARRPRLELTGDAGSQKWCVRRGEEQPGIGPWRVLCYGGDTRGWFSIDNDCYFRYDAGVSPASGMPGWEEHGADGVVYQVRCFGDPDHWRPSLGDGDGVRWIDYEYRVLGDEPPGYGGTPRVLPGLIIDAFNGMNLRSPDIGAAPPTSTAGLVGLQTWLWIEPTDQTWGPASYAVTAGGWRVRAQAEGQQVVWHTGDGRGPLTCPDPGTAWQPGWDHDSECGHTYHRPSRDEPGGGYQLTATVRWQVTWTVNGAPAMSASIDTSTTVPYRVNEIQVLVTHP